MTLHRKALEKIQKHFAKNKTALLVTGARQIGKTHVIREFGKEFKNFVEINFVENKEALSILQNETDAKEVLSRLSVLSKTRFVKGKTLIFFDEVQKCPEMVTAIKFLVDEGSYSYILSGSLLGVELRSLRSVPVGYMEVLNMYPLNLEEFFIALGVSPEIIEKLHNNWETRTPVDDFIHRKMMELFRLYLIVGGMPAVVNKYVTTNNLRDVIALQRSIIRLYKFDIAQYDPNQKLQIEEIFDLIAPELNSHNKRFILKNLNENAKFERYHNQFLWLANAGVALPIFNIEEPKMPLLLARSRNLFKLFMCDVGLLASQYADNIQIRILAGEKDINHGSIYENAVAQELVSHEMSTYYYNNKRRGELDFVVEIGGKVVPIEVKSGKDYEVHRALANIMDCSEYDLPEAFVLCNDNLRRKGRITYAPIYMSMFIKPIESNLDVYKIDLSGLQ